MMIAFRVPAAQTKSVVEISVLTDRAVYISLAPRTLIVQLMKLVAAASVNMLPTVSAIIAPTTLIAQIMKAVVTTCVNMITTACISTLAITTPF